MSQTSSYHQYFQDQLNALLENCKSRLFVEEAISEDDQTLLDQLLQLCSHTDHDDDYYQLGQAVIGKIIAHYPALTPLVSRDLFWYFGGDCLHHMSDDEIASYQVLDDLIYDQRWNEQKLDIPALKAQAFQQH